MISLATERLAIGVPSLLLPGVAVETGRFSREPR